MIFKTKNFGEIEIKEDDIITFTDGIPGFEELQRYVIIENPDEEVPFAWLQSLEDMELTFVIVNPFVFKKDYDFTLKQNVMDKLEIKSHEDLSVYSIVIIPEDIKNMTANLFAPIIINNINRKAKQVLLDDSKYSKKHLILEEIKRSTLENHDAKKEGTLATGEGL